MLNNGGCDSDVAPPFKIKGMKKVILMFLMAFMMQSINAQRIDYPGEPYDYYIQFTAVSDLKGKIKVEINFSDDKRSKYLLDDKGDKLCFYSLSEVFTYFSKRGWVYAENFSYGHDHVYIFKKKVLSDEQAKEHLAIDNK